VSLSATVNDTDGLAWDKLLLAAVEGAEEYGTPRNLPC
jgi:hypothetical protein